MSYRMEGNEKYEDFAELTLRRLWPMDGLWPVWPAWPACLHAVLWCQ
jgi:hypothetical protein